MSQMKQVIEKLVEEGKVSRNWALSNFISRLSAIIYNLKDLGWTFETKKVPTKKPDGSDGWDYIYIVLEKGENPYEKKGDKNAKNNN